jgi:protein-disulfide isomerase-like protein with CxxC motif
MANSDFEAVFLKHLAQIGRQTGVVFNEKYVNSFRHDGGY